MQHRELGSSGIQITPLALGCWPIAGMTSIDVNDADSLATLEAAADQGINFFDTAYCYGPNGESEKLIAQAIGDRRDEIVIATKGGLHWGADLERIHDASPKRLRLECEESLARLQTDRVELLYLHAPDSNTPVEESAGELKRLMDEGKTRAVGVSNLSVEQMGRFAAECPISACQPPDNMLQRDIERDVLPWCKEHGASTIVYWPLMKGLLAGKLPRDHQFQPGDGRAKYPMFQGEEWNKNQDFLDQLQEIAAEIGKTVAQLVINWTVRQPGITAALCGSKRAAQVEENAGAVGWELTDEQLRRID
ncbi:MAG: aldo/keto reductase, partial [Planctomycetales bacterium]